MDVSTGLRIGELLALGWRDIDFEKFEISVTRSISLQHVGDWKTEASRKPIPMEAELAEALWRWRHSSGYRKVEDWIFASPAKDGQQPYRPGTLYPAHLKPVAKAAGISAKIGLAYFPAHLCHAALGEWRRYQNDQCVASLHNNHVFVVIMGVGGRCRTVAARPKCHLTTICSVKDITLNSRRRLIAARYPVCRMFHGQTELTQKERVGEQQSDTGALGSFPECVGDK